MKNLYSILKKISKLVPSYTGIGETLFIDNTIRNLSNNVTTSTCIGKFIAPVNGAYLVKLKTQSGASNRTSNSVLSKSNNSNMRVCNAFQNSTVGSNIISDTNTVMESIINISNAQNHIVSEVTIPIYCQEGEWVILTMHYTGSDSARLNSIEVTYQNESEGVEVV